MTTRVVLTYRDYAALPNDGRRYEIHEGELSLTVRAAGDESLSAPPFSDLVITAATLWR